MRILLCALLMLATVGCGDMLTSPSTNPPYQSQFNPQPTPRDQNACKDFGVIVCPVR
jgi:hypothetical protein